MIVDYSFLVVVGIVLGVTIALNVRDWCMRHGVPYDEYRNAFTLVARVSWGYIMLLAWYVLAPGVSPDVRTITSRVVFWLWMLALIHACRGPMEYYLRHVLLTEVRGLRIKIYSFRRRGLKSHRGESES